MSDDLFEVSFAGVVRDGEDPAEVRAKVGKMFNADEAKLAQLFSGKRIIIKKNIDQATAAKYQTALTRAGAECEVRPMGGAAPAAAEPQAAPAATEAAPAAAAAAQVYQTQYDGEVAPPPQTDPLGITGDQIEDLSATIAPVGSELQDEYQAPDEPQIDISGLDMAPVGSDLSDGSKQAEPPPPDTTGITLAED
ncbi:MAG: hypothetical protein QNJ85_01065 [Gammaproteobacteria bacterium]|nr:hypothetical protein [Gammaproteobacteria bacterium]